MKNIFIFAIALCTLISPLTLMAAPANHIATALPVDLFYRAINACNNKDYDLLLNQFSKSTKSFILAHNKKTAHLKNYLSKICGDISFIVKTELKGKPEAYHYGIKKMGIQNELCFYPAAKHIQTCTGGLRVAVEDGVLKFDEH
jgi:hypothetical protein